MTLPIYLTILGTIAFLAAVIGIFGLFIVSRGVARFSTRGVINVFLWLIVFAATALIMGSAREYTSQYSVTLSGYAGVMPWVVWWLRLSSVALVGVAAMAILMNWSKRSTLRGGTWLLVGLAAMFVAGVASSVLGTKPEFIHQSLYTVLLMLALALTPPIAPELVAVYAKRVLAFLLYGSLILALINPEHYVQTGYSGIIPGFNFRLHGLAPHANGLGPLALLYLLLAYWVPGKRFWHLLGNLVALVVLILAQSKTAWLTALFTLFVLLAYRLSQQVSMEMKSARVGWVTTLGLGLFFTLLLSTLAIFVTANPLDTISRIVTADSELSTLTGRTEIWETTLDTWRRAPWFGYGPTLWDVDFRITHGVLAAWHAHNQYIQALGEAGLVGLGALLLYVGALLGYGIKFASETRGVSLALVFLMLIRSISEIPFKMSVLLDVSFLVHFIVFAVLLMLVRRASGMREVPPVSGWNDAALPRTA
jgi:O-antigen ligase